MLAKCALKWNRVWQCWAGIRLQRVPVQPGAGLNSPGLQALVCTNSSLFAADSRGCVHTFRWEINARGPQARPLPLPYCWHHSTQSYFFCRPKMPKAPEAYIPRSSEQDYWSKPCPYHDMMSTSMAQACSQVQASKVTMEEAGGRRLSM